MSEFIFARLRLTWCAKKNKDVCCLDKKVPTCNVWRCSCCSCMGVCIRGYKQFKRGKGFQVYSYSCVVASVYVGCVPPVHGLPTSFDRLRDNMAVHVLHKSLEKKEKSKESSREYGVFLFTRSAQPILLHKDIMAV